VETRKRLSIIIPVYNVENYIEKCIRSLEEQDLPKTDYEIIVTNDGSPDKCREIVEKLQNEFTNIVLINQENQGVSMARNNAIAIAKGKYLLPIDPDDYVLPNTFNAILEKAESENLDVLYLGFEIFDIKNNSIWKTNYKNFEGKVYNGVEGYFAHRDYDVRDPDRSVALLYRIQMLDKHALKYPKDVPYLEDGLFLAKVFSVANKVGYNDATFYQRTTRIGSATNSKLFYTKYSVDGFIKAVKDVQRFAINNKLENEQLFLVNHIISKFVFLSLSPSIGTFNFKEYFKTLKALKQANLDKLESKGVRFMYYK
jgi:glycosyltransferase involved in cell wall biosynthesis